MYAFHSFFLNHDFLLVFLVKFFTRQHLDVLKALWYNGHQGKMLWTLWWCTLWKVADILISQTLLILKVILYLQTIVFLYKNSLFMNNMHQFLSPLFAYNNFRPTTFFLFAKYYFSLVWNICFIQLRLSSVRLVCLNLLHFPILYVLVTHQFDL